MDRPHAFRGASGRVYTFEGPLARRGNTAGPGLALFAAPQAQGWRVIHLIDIMDHDPSVRLIQARAEAYALGGDAMFFLPMRDGAARRAAHADLDAGFQPLRPGLGHGRASSRAARPSLAA